MVHFMRNLQAPSFDSHVLGTDDSAVLCSQ
jgi:hypothetical protein